ncbi:protein STRUBBELIG-RECEPTOR FAMILY 7-like isoform X1 [Juglans microcarpa x Juglans regia]|uniref:protein STRUBBELIG-RECEPTOR FAMILY 7-like isoform X1 n=2 Tax=Juglans microcarpa x Juglans regia TaxID=2249226 RepID=UPI001B7E93D1|nr:protein STRUBBELIG-RECEPTOR FAMILY 7-like isoform X1 [Juglans microcarpa x Juglans regia]
MLENWRVAAVVFSLCILGPRPSSVDAATDPSEAAALRDMYSSLNSPPQLTQWSSTGDDPCGQSWKGVTCTGSRVTEIKLSGLGLSGSMGYHLSSLTMLTNLDMSNNNLAGEIPYSLPPNVSQLNLAYNTFNKGVPYSISQMASLKYLNISHNQLQEQLFDAFGQLSSLSTLDLSFNSLPGNLPQSFSSLSSMTSMYLQNNLFTGNIDVLANLPLENLNIENNHFTGWIPEQLQNINLQKNGNSWSSEPAPPPPPGTPPARKRPNHKSGGNESPSDGSGGGNKPGIGGGGIAGIVISIFIVGAIVAFFLMKRRSRRPLSDIEKLDNQPFAPLASIEVQEMKAVQTSSVIKTHSFDTNASINLRPPPIDRHKSFDEDCFPQKPIVAKKANIAPINATSYSVADLQMATDSFSVENLLGEGSFGRVYQGRFDDGKILAVKKIDSSALPAELSEEFTEMVSNISQLHHQNIAELVGYCSEHGHHLLVYEFHKSGSLHDFLHLYDDYSKPLTWNSRVKIALGIARALEYLHEVCSPSVVHKNIKSANILLDAELNPHLSDSGLGSLVPNADQILSRNAGSGYSATEVAMSGQYTLKSDVYSFGVVMLELLSGRKPFDSTRPRSEQSLVRWATPQLHDIDALGKMVDPALKGLYPVKSLSRFADVIALCIQLEPEFRPPMSEVVQALVRLVQRTNMSKRTIANDLGASQRAVNSDTHE